MASVGPRPCLSATGMVLGPKRVLAAMAAVLFAAFFAGCSSSPKMQPSSATAPEKAAVTYAVDLYSGNLKGASDLVYPPDRHVFNIVSAVIRGNVISAEGVSAGGASVRGSTAIVVLEGKFCTGARGGPSSPHR